MTGVALVNNEFCKAILLYTWPKCDIYDGLLKRIGVVILLIYLWQLLLLLASFWCHTAH